MKIGTITVELTVDPLQLTIAERKSFKISIAATNEGGEVIDPGLGRAQLFVNDKWSIAWMLAISNGRREAKWSALPPGETVSMSWSSMGESLFPDPGEFALVLHYNDAELPAIQVQVLAQ